MSVKKMAKLRFYVRRWTLKTLEPDIGIDETQLPGNKSVLKLSEEMKNKLFSYLVDDEKVQQLSSYNSLNYDVDQIVDQMIEVYEKINDRLSNWAQREIEDLIFVESSDRYQWWIFDGWLWRANRQYTKEEIELLILDEMDKERRKFERLKKKYKQTEDVAEARRERIPEDVRIFVWRRDEGKCVKCGSQENLEYDRNSPRNPKKIIFEIYEIFWDL